MKPHYTFLATTAICLSSAYGQMVNGSFETNTWNYGPQAFESELDSNQRGALDSSGVPVAVPSWTLDNGADIAMFNLADPGGTTDGDFAAALDFKQTVYQNITFASTGTYQISFDVFVENGGKEGYEYSVLKDNGSKPPSSIVNGSGAKADTGSALTISETFAVTSTATDDYRFSITQNSGNGGFLFVDNVSITPVPEPSSAALLGLGGLALIFRRRS